jgi:hypothetical protein
MRALVRLGALAVIAAGLIIGSLWLSGAVAGKLAAEIALRTAGILALLFMAAVAWRNVRRRANAPDRTDQPVP